jgi:CRP/FNR family cyclic AMP-dependent transcriptional regulator
MEDTSLRLLQRYFYEQGMRTYYPKHKIIILQGDSLGDVYFVIKGVYKIYNIDENGEERTITITGKDSIFPLSWQLINQPTNGAIFFYEAYTDLIAYKVNIARFKTMLRRNVDVIFYLLSASSEANIALESRVQSLQRSKIEEKTEFVLYYLAKRLGHSDDGHIFEIDKPITQQDIADLAGVNRETAARFLLGMYANRISWKRGIKYYIDIDKLHKKYISPVFG